MFSDHSSESWLLGTDFTAADISLTITLSRLLFVGYGHALWEGGKLPLVSKYLERVQTRPSYITVVSKAFSPFLMLRMAFGEAVPYMCVIGAVGLGVLAYYLLPKLHQPGE